MDVQIKLNEWRTEIKPRDFPGIMYASSMILKDETIALLASVGPITSQQHLQQTLLGQWLWIDEYGGALYRFMSSKGYPLKKSPTSGPKSEIRASRRPPPSYVTLIGIQSNTLQVEFETSRLSALNHLRGVTLRVHKRLEQIGGAWINLGSIDCAMGKKSLGIAAKKLTLDPLPPQPMSRHSPAGTPLKPVDPQDEAIAEEDASSQAFPSRASRWWDRGR
ncbi:hypothetical protein B0H14DRAFT_2582480 [Mycena olivaceomarginata]|nr:hypothetical protein B0H14DRAFT_2582480 [Mycena olivaceomarginata]